MINSQIPKLPMFPEAMNMGCQTHVCGLKTIYFREVASCAREACDPKILLHPETLVKYNSTMAPSLQNIVPKAIF